MKLFSKWWKKKEVEDSLSDHEMQIKLLNETVKDISDANRAYFNALVAMDKQRTDENIIFNKLFAACAYQAENGSIWISNQLMDDVEKDMEKFQFVKDEEGTYILVWDGESIFEDEGGENTNEVSDK